MRGARWRRWLEDLALRVSWNAQRYMMTYTHSRPKAHDRPGPIGGPFPLAASGLATFGLYHGTEIGDVDDKDASVFPIAIPNPSGQPELAMLHRPLFPGTRPEETACHPATREWISIGKASGFLTHPWCSMAVNHIASAFCLSSQARDSRVALGAAQIGGGTPPILTGAATG